MPSRKTKTAAPADDGRQDERVAPVTFRDLSHLRRPLRVAGQHLQVERGRVTTDHPDAIGALDARGDFQREDA